jgi:hypothetical protein
LKQKLVPCGARTLHCDTSPPPTLRPARWQRRRHGRRGRRRRSRRNPPARTVTRLPPPSDDRAIADRRMQRARPPTCTHVCSQVAAVLCDDKHCAGIMSFQFTIRSSIRCLRVSGSIQNVQNLNHDVRTASSHPRRLFLRLLSIGAALAILLLLTEAQSEVEDVMRYNSDKYP